MKDRYIRYGKRSKELFENLSDSDRNILNDFIDYCAITSGRSRLAKYRMYVTQFQDIVEKPLDQIDKGDAIRFWGLVKEAPFTEHTRIDIKRSVKRFLKWYYRDLDMIEPLVIKRILFNHEKINKSVLITNEELQNMLRRAEKLRDKAILVTLYETGARTQEIRNLKWKDVNWKEKEITLYSGKKMSNRSLPVRDSIDHLKRWKDEWVFSDPSDDDYIFPSTIGSSYNRSKSISVSYVNRIIKTLAQKAGISRDIYPYLFRHSRLTHVRKCGVQGIVFNQYADHRPGSRQEGVYVHLDNSDMKKEVIDKVFKANALPKTEKQEYEDRINQLENQMNIVLQFLQESKSMLLPFASNDKNVSIDNQISLAS